MIARMNNIFALTNLGHELPSQQLLDKYPTGQQTPLPNIVE